MRCSAIPALLLGLATLAAAVYRDEVDDIDFHYALVGIPQPDTTFFHRPRRDDKASLLYTLSDLGVLAAVNPTNGDLVWRHRLAEHDDLAAEGTEAGFLRAPEGDDWLVTAYGSGVQAWSALTGRNIWRADFGGRIKDLEMLDLTADSTKDVLALFDEDGVTVLRRLDGSRGSVVWEFRETSKDVPLQVSNDIANVYVISLSGSGSSFSLKVTSLETATGTRVENWTLGAKGDVRAARDVMFVGANSAAPVAAWVDRAMAKLSVNVIGTKAKHEFLLPAGVASVHVHAPHLAQSQPHFLVHTQTGEDDAAVRTNKAFVFHTDLKTGHVAKAYELPAFRGDGSYSTSCEGANVYFAQVGADETLVVSSESHGILARIPHKQGLDVGPVHAVTEVVKKADSEFAVRSAVVTYKDDWTLLRNGDKDWTRHEGLSDAVAAVWAEIPEREDLARALAEEAHTNPLSAYMHRVKRHVVDLRHLPAYLAKIPERVLKSVAGGEADNYRKQGLWRDGFGFNKIVVVATRRGRLYGLDSGNHGRVIWTRDTLPLGGQRPLVVRGLVADDERGTVAMYGSSGWYAVLDASSGAVDKVSTDSKPVSCTASVLGELLPIGADGMPTSGLPAGWDAEQTVVVRGEGETLEGVKFRRKDVDGGVSKQVMWQFRLRPGLKISTLATIDADETVASIGRVLGDRRVLYKYLNANSVLVAAADESARTLSVQLLDGVSGQVLAAQQHRGVDASLPVSCAMAENWYACAFFGDYALDDKTGRAIKGHQLVVTDLYESSEPDSRGPLADASNSSTLDPISDATADGLPLPWATSQAVISSQPLTQLSVSRTRQGIATRQLIAYLPSSHSVIGLPRPVIDPRRPVGRDPSAAEAEAEGLPRYAPALELDARAVISHERDVIAGAGFVAAPAAVESTTLVAAFGVDVFVSRVAPSGGFDVLGKGFGKLSLVGTVLALLGGVLALGPMVHRKQINQRWEANL
ncbi:hypothetical protein XA68_11620 [Ophiocordyceps unilateralis]|uniref:ER membrane protein complex subunit 1 n=1 Tax=Ophiocordyceps unilateralis TaxID=268505 RepID=A0A2A9PN95_OPHUN|nr:hypothetical protein XA68_11620 [Ophiocordyceps unilateralis]